MTVQALSSSLVIMVIGDPSPDFLADNVRCAIEDAGHTAVVVPAFPLPDHRPRQFGVGRLVSRARDASYLFPDLAMYTHRRVLNMAEELSPDLIVNLDYRLNYSIVDRLRDITAAPVCFWFPDSPGNVRQETFLLAGYDALFFTDSRQVRAYRDVLGLNAHFLAEGCNPRWHRPSGPLAGPLETPRAVVVGNMYAVRFVLLQRLLAEGIDLDLHGSAWPKWLPKSSSALLTGYSGRLVLKDDKARAFRSGSVALNSLSSHEGDGLNTRLYEAAACGAIVLTEWRPGLEQAFEVGEEVFAYRTFSELVSQMRALASMEVEQRQRISMAASFRAHRDHALSNRVRRILQVVGSG